MARNEAEVGEKNKLNSCETQIRDRKRARRKGGVRERRKEAAAGNDF